MARFRFLGEKAAWYTRFIRVISKIRVPTDTDTVELIAPDAALGFRAGDELDYDFTDDTSLLFLRNESRFEEVQ